MLDGLGRFFVHANELGSMDDFNGQTTGFGVLSQFSAHHILQSDQEHSNVTLPCGQNRALYFRLGGAVCTHGINRDGN